MVEVVKTEKIKGIRAGRRGYSQDVEVSAIPQIRSYQEPAYWVKDFTIPAGGSTTFSKEFEYAHFITNLYVSVSANVLIFLEIKRKDGSEVVCLYGYQDIVEEIPATYPFEEATVTIENKGDVKIEGSYTHYAIKGLEKIEQIGGREAWVE